jgi:uncharacterized SAM-binding protein YcdF (DUF218 family)
LFLFQKRHGHNGPASTTPVPSQAGQLLIRSGIRALAALGAVLLLVTLTPVTAWWGRLLTVPWNDGSGDILIVLGGSLYEAPDQPPVAGPSTFLRSVHAVDLWRHHHYRHLIVAGAGGAAEVMQGFLVASGVPRDSIVLETASATTRENAIRVKDLLDRHPDWTGTLVVLTSDYHTLRARECFRRAGMKVTTVSAPDVSKRSLHWEARWDCLMDLGGETARLLYYKARGWI